MLKNKYSLSKNVNFIFVSGKTFFTQTEKNLFMHTLDLLSFLSKIGASFENSTIPSNIGVEEEEFSIIINELLEYGVIEEGVMSREDDEDKNLYDTLRILKFRKKNVFLDYEDSKLTILKKEKLTREYEKDTKKTLYQDQNEFGHILPIPGYSSANSLVDQLSNLLYFTNGTVSDARAYSRYNVSLKPTPSNGACHPVVIFIQLFNVNGLNGVYRYISNSHSLKKHPLRIRNKSKNKIKIFIGIEFEKEQWRYRHSFNYVDTLIDLGHVSGQLNIVADNMALALSEKNICEDEELLSLGNDLKISIMKYYSYDI